MANRRRGWRDYQDEMNSWQDPEWWDFRPHEWKKGGRASKREDRKLDEKE